MFLCLLPVLREKTVVNVFDIFVVVVIVGLAILGFREGLVRGALKLGGFIVLIVAMALFSAPIMSIADMLPMLPRNIAIPLVFLIILAAGTCIIHFAALLLHKLIHMTPAGFIAYGLGCAFGIIKALFLNGLLAIIISCAPPGSFFRNQYETSFSAKPLVAFISETIPIVKNALVPYYQRFAPPPPEPERKRDEILPPNII